MTLPVVTTQHVCLTCSRLQHTCCTNGYQVPLTKSDVERIVALGHPLASFAKAAEYLPEDLDEDEPEFTASMAVVDGRYYRAGTQHDADGACVFLKKGVGCTLGDKRPTICKMYPFWADDDGSIHYNPEELTFCHMARIGTSVDAGLAMLSETPATIRAYTKAFDDDARANAAWHRELARSLVPPRLVEEGQVARDEEQHADQA